MPDGQSQSQSQSQYAGKAEEWTIETLKQHFDAVIALNEARHSERFHLAKEQLEMAIGQNDTRYAERFRATDVAIEAQEKARNAALTSFDRATTKAEDAQREYNARSNQFQGRIDDQQKTLMPRAESDTRFSALDDKIAVLQRALDDKIAAAQKAFDDKLAASQAAVAKETDSITEEIRNLRDSRSEASGRHIAFSELMAYAIALLAIAAGVLAHYIH